MINRASLLVCLVMFSSGAAIAQVISISSSDVAGLTGIPQSFGMTSPEQFRNDMWTINGLHSPLETPSGSLSKLDLKAPGKARREYEKGYQLLMRKDLQGAVPHLVTATSVYSSFVAAHNALGAAYLGLDRNDQAHAEFAQAVALDDHLAISYLNLGCAELALKNFSAAEDSLRKASSIAPLDLQLLTALTYGQLMNRNYSGAVATANQIHGRKHDGAAMIHFFAAAAWDAQNNLPQAQHELLTLLREDPKSPAALQAVQIIEDLKKDPTRPRDSDPGLKISYTTVSATPSGPVQLPERIRRLLQDAKENSQIAEAEAESECSTCASDEHPATAAPSITSATVPRPKTAVTEYDGMILHATADEVAVFFAATDHRKPVTNLTTKDIGIHDDHRPPAAVFTLRNESQLPLRLGLVIDTSASVEGRFKFEQDAATNFMRKVVTGPDDLAFVVGFANSVLMVQDFTGDQKLIAHAVGQLVPSGGTALWDAVAFAADKLAGRTEAQPVARVLVVISDGEDNSSSASLKQAINRAQHGEVAIYTVSTREAAPGSAIENLSEESLVGDHALNTLAELTGGTAFTPGSVRGLNGSLADLQQVIRSRYLISYKPALFQRNGKYRAIDITAEKDGRKLRVYARKGYYAAGNAPSSERF
jgi:Ca-activated chloride channel homolog